MKDNTLKESTVLNFMNLTLDMELALGKPYSRRWKDLPYNFYAKKFQVVHESTYLLVRWLNPNDERRYVLFRKPLFRMEFLNRLYFLFYKEISTDDPNRSTNVLYDVVFPYFCKELDIAVDFSDIDTSRDAANTVLCALYEKYFTEYPSDKFITMFGLDKLLTKDSISYIKQRTKGFVKEEVANG